jgi:hypothetical protein
MLRQQNDDRIAAYFGAAPGDLSVGIRDDRVRGRIPLWQPRFARKTLVRLRGIGFALGKLLPRDAPDDP